METTHTTATKDRTAADKSRAAAAMNRSPIQPSLEISEPGDMYEQEADATADRVMMMPEPVISRQEEDEGEEIAMPKEEGQVQSSWLQKQAEEEEEEPVQMKTDGNFSQVDRSWIQAKLKETRHSGSSLDGEVKGFMESRFGSDFSSVQVHTDQESALMNREIRAKAFTTGNHIYFNSGNYDASSSSGRKLLAHELTHVVQQNGFRPKANSTDPSMTSGQSHAPTTSPSVSRMLQRVAIGTGAVPWADWRRVPNNHRNRVNSGIGIIHDKIRSQRLKNYFRDTAPGGTNNTLRDVANRAKVWEMRNAGSMGESFVGGSDMAYDTFIYGIGRYQIAATLLHEMGHLASFATEQQCENAMEMARVYAPLIRTVSPRSARPGDRIRITGISFGPSQESRDKVKFNGTDAGAVNSWGWNHTDQGIISVNVPAGATSGPLVVENNTVRSNGVNFNVLP